MNRAYDANLVLNACKKIRQVKENAFLACDVITGFEHFLINKRGSVKETPHIFDSYTLHLDYLLVFLLL